jgi:16S rRNA processing protein RimM
VRVVVGRVVRPHGIRGELVVQPSTDRPALRFRPGQVLGTASGRELVVTGSRPHAGRLLLTVAAIGDRTAAEQLRQTDLWVEVDEHEPAEQDAYYDAQLVGLEVRDDTGVIGTVRAVEHGPAQDLLVVHLAGPDRDVRVPFVSALVPRVDLVGGWLEVSMPPGLADLDEGA